MARKNKMVYKGMGEYADSFIGSGEVPNIRTVPRAPSRQLLNQVHKFAAMRADELYNPQPIKGGYVHRPMAYRGVGAGMYNQVENDDYFEGGNRFMDELKRGFNPKHLKKGFDKLNKQVLTPMATATKFIAPLLGPEGLPVSAALGALGYGQQQMKPKKVKGNLSKSYGRDARALIVKQVMNDRGVSMIKASKIVKKEGLY